MITPISRLFDQGKQLDHGRYFFIRWSAPNLVRSDSDDNVAICEVFQRGIEYGNPSHVATIVIAVRHLVESKDVDEFTIGVSSRTRGKAAQAGMMSRFCKFSPEGYTTMVGLLMLDGRDISDAESIALALDKQLRGIFKAMCGGMFDSVLSYSQSASLSPDNDRLFILYIALRMKP